MKPNTTGKAAEAFVLTSLKIKLLDTKVYRNGRQQARIELELEATRAGKDAYLTEAEEKRIKIFDHEEPLIYLPFYDDQSPNASEGWSASHVNRNYDFHPESGSTPPESASPIDEFPAEGKVLPPKKYFFYITANSQASGNLRVSFAITADDGSIWRSTGWVSYPGEPEQQQVPGLVQADDITLQQVPPVVYSYQNIVLSRSPLAGPKGSNEAADLALFDDMVTVSIVAPGGDTLPIREMTCEPAGVIHWINQLPDTRNPCFFGYAQPGSKVIEWNDKVETGEEPLPILTSATTDRGVIVLCGRLDIPRYAGAPEGAVVVNMVDTYGTSQTCRVQFVKGERDKLEVM